MKRIFIVLMTAFLSLSMYAAEVAVPSYDAAQQVFKKKQADIREVVFSVAIHCRNCVKKVEENIAFEKGVKDMKVSLEEKTVTIKYDASKTSEDKLKAAIESLGYSVVVKK